MDIKFFKSRRNEFFRRMEDGIAIFFSAPQKTRNNDVEYPYRQDSDFFYLTGWTEPESVVVLSKKGKEEKFIMFVRPHDETQELWTGKRLGVEGALSYGADEAFEINRFWEMLPEILKNQDLLYYKIGEDSDRDKRIFKIIEELKEQARFGNWGPWDVVDPRKILWQLRMFKTDYEIENLKKAAQITTEAFSKIMQETRVGMYEYEVAAMLEYEFKKRGCQRLGFETITAAGSNATTLHYIANNAKIKENQLLLVDAGCEYNYITSDVTRTFPPSGRFASEAVKDLYQLVLTAQLNAISKVRPGNTYQDVHMEAVRTLTDGMIQLKILKEGLDQAIENKSYFKYFPHRIGHWLGMDVHDCGPYFEDGESIKLRPGMVMTVEPGLYIPQDDMEVPEKFRGVGIRIEDDCLVTDNGCEVLTSPPKEVKDITT